MRVLRVVKGCLRLLGVEGDLGRLECQVSNKRRGGPCRLLHQPRGRVTNREEKIWYYMAGSLDEIPLGMAGDGSLH